MALINEPIVLGSNITGNYGALPGDPNYYTQEDPTLREGMVENEDGTFTIPTYQRSQNEIASDFDWSMYGSKYAPMLRYFNSVKTGEFIYDPSEDQISEEEATALAGDFTTETGLDPKEVIKQELIDLGGQIAAGAGAQIGRAYAQTGDIGEAASAYGKSEKFSNFFMSPEDDPLKLTSKISSSGPFDQQKLQIDFIKRGGEAGKAAEAALKSTPNNPLNADASTQYLESIKNDPVAVKQYKTSMAAIPSGPETYFGGVSDRLGFGGEKGTLSSAGKANLYGSGGAAATTIAYNLIKGENLKESVKAGIKVGVGTYVGTAFGGAFGGMIGGLVGGRVICNELMRQGIMTRKQVVLDYKFTRDHLTPTHVNGYHVWAVWMVKQMRKGRLVNFWTHVAGHRANEIAYIYGERDKPDYLGKVYRKVLEPICWSIGFFCQKTDWTVLYKEKEI